jgi:predicted dinucleotide-binding enzyme
MGMGEQVAGAGEHKLQEVVMGEGKLQEVVSGPGHATLPRVCIVGTGAFGCALSGRLARRGVPHVVASRSPGPGQLGLEPALREGGLIVLAVPAAALPGLPLALLPAGAVVVECSNRRRECPPGRPSQAEEAAACLPPGIALVKALNTVSAHQLEQDLDLALRPVPIASDSGPSKAVVASLLSSLGLPTADHGALVAARRQGVTTTTLLRLENLPLALFPAWRAPLAISALLWCLIYAVTFGRYHLCHE